MQEEIASAVNGNSLITARKTHLRQTKRIEFEVQRIRLEQTEVKIEECNQELASLPAPDWAHTRLSRWFSILEILIALLLGVGFILFAEYSMNLIGFDWGPWKLRGASFMFWLGTVVAIHIYLARENRTELSDLPKLLGGLPLVLSLIGLSVLAITRGLRPFVDVSSDSASNPAVIESLGVIASWSGLLTQLTLSLALDLVSGVVGWHGSNRLSYIAPIYRTYREVHRLTAIAEKIQEKLAVLSVELGIPLKSTTSTSTSPSLTSDKPLEGVLHEA